MDLTSLYYFQELSKDLNMTKTAERLYISQQTLSNHIQRLEQYYGTKLFYRKPSLSLTCAGEFVLSFAQVVGKEERNLKDILSDVEHQERGTLRVGASMARGTQFLPRILPDFHQMYPRVEVRFVEGLSRDWKGRPPTGSWISPWCSPTAIPLIWWSMSSCRTISICACQRICFGRTIRPRRCGNGKSRRSRGLSCGTLTGFPLP